MKAPLSRGRPGAAARPVERRARKGSGRIPSPFRKEYPYR